MPETLSIASIVLSCGLALVGAILRYSVTRQDAERDRRFRQLESDVDGLRRASHGAEVAVVRVEGQLAVLRTAHESAVSVLEEIRGDMIGRREWEARMNGFEESLRGIREQLLNVARLIGRADSGGAPSTRS